MKQFIEDCEKLEKVVRSCKTKEQLTAAWNYYLLWDSKYPLEKAPRHALVRNVHSSAFVLGYFSALVKNEI